MVYFVVFLVVISFFLCVYIKIRSKKYYRERYSFAVLSASVSLITLGVWTVSDVSIWNAVLTKIFGINQSVTSLSTFEKISILMFLTIVIKLLTDTVNKWNGLVSVDQNRRVSTYQEISWFKEGLQEGKRIVLNQKLEVFTNSNENLIKNHISSPIDNLVWHDQIRELIILKWPSLSIDATDWHERENCWIGSNIKTNETVAVYCIEDYPSELMLNDFLNYVNTKIKSKSESNIFYVVTEKETNTEWVTIGTQKVIIESEARLIEKLVDFSHYFKEISKRAIKDKLPDSSLTCNDIYVPSTISFQKQAAEELTNVGEELESYIQSWEKEESQRHIAVLGEYGQGKSTGMLMYSYNAIKRIKEGSRIPILIELRGKSPSTLLPLELLATWASTYDINPKALMKLIIFGKVTLIFEGFDEMAEVSYSDSRINHLYSLWQFAYPKAKIIITGRPNFFLDDKELIESLGIGTLRSEGPSCQAVYLQPFSIGQIRKSLRWADYNIKDQIENLFERDSKFKEIISRPSLLYIVAQLWENEKLSELKEEMSSALIMKLFINHSYRRQTEKHRDQRQFMILNESERSYFMMGIAAFMAKNGLKNQILNLELEQAVAALYKEIPDDMENSEFPIKDGRKDRPLKERLEEKDNPLEILITDVRTYGILVKDYSRSDSLKFPHKSFFEYLFAEYTRKILGAVNSDNSSSVNGIAAATLAIPNNIIKMRESLDFLIEMIVGKDLDILSRTNELKQKKIDVTKRLFVYIVKENRVFFITRLLYPFNQIFLLLEVNLILRTRKNITELENNLKTERNKIIFLTICIPIVIVGLGVSFITLYSLVTTLNIDPVLFSFGLLFLVFILGVFVGKQRNIKSNNIHLWIEICLKLGMSHREIKSTLYSRWFTPINFLIKTLNK